MHKEAHCSLHRAIRSAIQIAGVIAFIDLMHTHTNTHWLPSSEPWPRSGTNLRGLLTTSPLIIHYAPPTPGPHEGVRVCVGGDSSDWPIQTNSSYDILNVLEFWQCQRRCINVASADHLQVQSQYGIKDSREEVWAALYLLNDFFIFFLMANGWYLESKVARIYKHTYTSIHSSKSNLWPAKDAF